MAAGDSRGGAADATRNGLRAARVGIADPRAAALRAALSAGRVVTGCGHQVHGPEPHLESPDFFFLVYTRYIYTFPVDTPGMYLDTQNMFSG